MKLNMSKCAPEFKVSVQHWAKGKTVAEINKFFRLLEEFKCPMEPCYNMNKLNKVQKLLRKNKCGYNELLNGIYWYDVVENWTREDHKKFENANELNSILQSM